MPEPLNPYDPATYVVRTPSDVGWTALALAPQLESWMSRGHPDQVRLRAFLDDAVPRIAPMLGDSCGLELAVRLAEGVPLITGGRDLDNYLYPVAARIGASRLLSVFATKEHGETSAIRAGRVINQGPPENDWTFVGTHAKGPAGSSAWRDCVAANMGAVTRPAEAGPIEVQVTFRGNRRNWHQDWKPTIDGLRSILGLDRGGRNADDSRITRLALHRMPDASLGSTVLIGVWFRSTASSAPAI